MKKVRMAMSRYINAEYNLHDLYCYFDFSDEELTAISTVLKLIPTADVVDVVRCEDCVHQRYCQQYILHKGFTVERRDLKYCSYGERREDED